MIESNGVSEDIVIIMSMSLSGILKVYDITSNEDFQEFAKAITNCFNESDNTAVCEAALSFISVAELYNDYAGVANEFLAPFCDEDVSFASQQSFNGASGLSNLGATCYLNSVLQQVFFTFPVLFDVVNEESLSDDISLLKDIFIKLFTREESSVSTSDFIEAFNLELGGIFPTDSQHDAAEFFQVLVDRLPDASKRIFYGKTTTCYKDLNGLKLSERNEDFTTLNLILNKSENISEAYREFLRPQILNGDNKYEISPHNFIDAKMNTTITQFPPVLAIQLARFEFNTETGEKSKIDSYLEFPEDLSLSGHEYSLRGIIVHSGSSDFGHYFSHVKVENQWITLNDSYVTETSFAKIAETAFGGTSHSPNAYILFYESKEMSEIDGIPLHFSYSNSLGIDLNIRAGNQKEKVLTSSAMINCIAGSKLNINQRLHFFLAVALRSNELESAERLSISIIESARSNEPELIEMMHDDTFFSLIAVLFLYCDNEGMILILSKFISQILVNCSVYEASKSFLVHLMLILHNFTAIPERAASLFRFIDELYSPVTEVLISEAEVVQSTLSFFINTDQNSNFSSAFKMFAAIAGSYCIDPIMSFISENPVILDNTASEDSILNFFVVILKKGLIEEQPIHDVLGQSQNGEFLEQRMQYLLSK